MPKLPAICLLFIVTHTCFSQDTGGAKMRADSAIKMVPIKQGKYYAIAYSQGGVIITRDEVENRLKSDDGSAVELQMYKTTRQQKNTATIICESIGLVALIAANIQANQNGNPPGPPFNRAPVLFSISIGGMFGGIIPLAIKNDHLKKAIDIYNKRF